MSVHGICRLLISCLALAALLPARCLAVEEQQLERLSVGDLRLYYTSSSPTHLHYRGAPLIQGIYFYTAVQAEGGKMVEGFNFRRNEEGALKFAQEAVPGGHRLTWENRRPVGNPPVKSTDRLAGVGKIVLTLAAGEVEVRCTGKIEPNPGFGEIGFFVPEAILTGGQTAAWTATATGGAAQEGTFPLPEGAQGTFLRGIETLTAKSPRDTFAFAFAGQSFPGSNKLYVQDYRAQDTSRGCIRFVVSFSTAQGNTFDYSWKLRLPSAAGAAAVPSLASNTSRPDPALLPKVPPLALAAAAAKAPVLGEARPVDARRTGTPAPGGGLRLEVSEGGQLTLTDGDQVVATRDYCQLFGAGTVKREERQEGDLRRVVVTCDTPRGQLVKTAVVSRDEAWLAWSVRANEQVRGEVGFYCPEAALKPPFITYRSINQAMVGERPEPELGSTYCILSGGERDPREFQCGTSGRPDWIFQDHRAKGNVYRYVVTLSLAPGGEWRGVFRYVRRGAEAYPPVGFDRAREERGILASLLADAVTDGFTLVPARSTRYTLTGRPLDVTLKYYALDDAARTLRVSCKLTDLWGRSLPGGEYVLSNGGKRFAAIRFPVTLPNGGAYRMEMTYRSGEVTRTRELVLSALPEVPDTGLRPDSVFGAAIGGGDYLGTLAQRIGLKWNRCHCAVGDSQAGAVLPERGRYTWDSVEGACDFHRRYGLYACHSISEGWQAPWLTALWKEAPFEEYLKAYVEEYVRPMAVRFKGRIRCWEVTNEPYYQFRDCPEKWVALMKACYETLKEVDPECVVVGTCGPPGSMGYSWYRRTFALGALNYQDAVSSHLYHFGPWVGSATELTVRKWMGEIRAIMREHGKVLPLWNSETTVTPPASLYRHPSHTRYIQYHPGTAPTDPIEQAQIYFKVLVMHKAEDVKYSFHVFHGGTEHDSHTAEYDETPLAFVATQAALARHLETAKYVGDIALHGDLQACLFQQGGRLILIPWGPMFLKRDCAEVALPLPARRFTARDVFDNPLPVEGDARQTRLLVTWEAFFLIADGMSVAELKQACAQAKVVTHFTEAQGGAVKGAFGGEGAGPATRADWVGYHAVDLAPVANRGFSDEEPADGKGGWTDEGENDMRFLPTGEWRIHGVPFRVLDPRASGGRSCVILKGGPTPDAPFPERVMIPVGKRLSKLHFLHTVTWAGKSDLAFRYVLRYTDGVTEEVPVTVGRNVADWWTLGPLPEAQVAWEGPNPVREKVRLYHAQHEIKHPKGAQATLESIEIVTGSQRSIPVVVAITGVYSN